MSISNTTATSNTAPTAVRLADYSPSAYLIDDVDLRFELQPTATVVHARLTCRRNPQCSSPAAAITLNGLHLQTRHLALDAQPLSPSDYRIDDQKTLTISDVPERFVLDTEVVVNPADNKSLEGLYLSSGNFCTQCEAEGFRRITWYIDRPDVMARFTTTLIAARARYPVLLSNGNRSERGALDDGRHFVRWQDPYPKPAYLFALVGGDLGCVEDRFTTASGREITLQLWVQRHNVDRCAHALAALKKAMRWDEQAFGLEYDLDTYMIVAVDDFNMGAMENKGLNIFNSNCVLASATTATDRDYSNIEGIIAHEYFHNWTGNRVTCRDWFQLSLKEGLTVFRDQEFSSDMGSRALKRIHDVRFLRSYQFAEDAGPMAHPVRPDSYIEINNFYTHTVYEKGAELVRMIHTLAGADGFRSGLDAYFARHDGAAVTVEDFIAAMEDANDLDLGQFRRWYTQAGTPTVTLSGAFDATRRQYRLRLLQSCSATALAGEAAREPLHIPLRLALFAPDGSALPLRLASDNQQPTERLIELRESETTLVFDDVPQAPVLSIGRGFSAPVKLEVKRELSQLAFLVAHESDAFNRWDASQMLLTRILLARVEALQRQPTQAPEQQRQKHRLPAVFLQTVRRLLNDPALDAGVTAELLRVPGESDLADGLACIDVEAIHVACYTLINDMVAAFESDWRAVYRAHQSRERYRFDSAAAGRRSLKNLALAFLMQQADAEVRGWCLAQYETSDNMTDTLAALACFAHNDTPDSEAVMTDFERRWRHDPLVLDKWFALQASAPADGTLQRVIALCDHPVFDLHNPNRVRALIGAFCGNQRQFHAADGSGYRFLIAQAQALDAFNPMIAARLLSAFNRWRRLDAPRKALIEGQLERLLASGKLSANLYEVASKTLGGHSPWQAG